jgi:hypothetical protein
MSCALLALATSTAGAAHDGDREHQRHRLPVGPSAESLYEQLGGLLPQFQHGLTHRRQRRPHQPAERDPVEAGHHHVLGDPKSPALQGVQGADGHLVVGEDEGLGQWAVPVGQDVHRPGPVGLRHHRHP